MNRFFLLSIACVASACSPTETGVGQGATGAAGRATSQSAEGGDSHVSNGKTKVRLADVPAEVVAAAHAARANFTIAEAQAETRGGRRYFDVSGTLPDGTEVEFDIMEEGGSWRVVETQRDIPFAAVPERVRAAHGAGFTPSRVIESTQADGLVIYELFGEAGGRPEGRKTEIKWDGRRAEVLKEEWAH